MQEIDWKTALRRNRFFSIISESQRINLLKEESTKERAFPKGVKIFEEGDLEDKVYLVGSGVVEVYLLSKKKEKIVLNKLDRGELVGEMAMFDQKRRSANVVALEDCLALEMGGQMLRRIREKHPKFAAELSALADERLRHLGDEVLTRGQDDIDEQIRQLQFQLDVQQQTIDAKLDAAQTVFDQTSRRASEIIESAERARTRLAAMFSIAAILFPAAIGVLGYIGSSKLKSLDEYTQTTRETVDNRLEEIKSLSTQVNETLAEVDEKKEQIGNIHKQLMVVNEAVVEFHIRYSLEEFLEAVVEDPSKARKKFYSMLSVGDIRLTDMLFVSKGANKLFAGNEAFRDSFRKILSDGIAQGHIKTNLQKSYSYALLLTAMILLGQEDENYYDTLASFENFQRQLERRNGDVPNKELSDTIEALYKSNVDHPDPVRLANIKGIWARVR